MSQGLQQLVRYTRVPMIYLFHCWVASQGIHRSVRFALATQAACDR